MHIAILSDIHDNIWNLQTILKQLPATDTLICCGDLCSPFVVGLLANGYANPIHIVFGNNDGDLFRITQQAARFGHVHLHGEYLEETFGGRRFAVTHYPEIAASIGGAAETVDVICFGHNHKYGINREGKMLYLNPGPVMGYNPGSGEDVSATFLIYNTVDHEAVGYKVVAGQIVPC